MFGKSSEKERQRQAGLMAYQLYQQQQSQANNSPTVTADIELATQPASTPDHSLPFNELEKRAKAGDVNSQFLVGRGLLTGTLGAVQNSQQAIQWLGKARAQGTSSPAGLCAEGICHKKALNGITAINRDTAMNCFKSAADRGYIPAMFELAHMQYEDSKSSPEKSYDYIKLLNAAANAHYIPAYELLANCYREGRGVEESHKEALRLYRLAAGENGSAYSKMYVGKYYEHGWAVVNINKTEAKKMYRAARDQGQDVDSRLGSCCSIS